MRIRNIFYIFPHSIELLFAGWIFRCDVKNPFTVDQHSVVLFEISTLGSSSKVLQLQTIAAKLHVFSSIPSCIAE